MVYIHGGAFSLGSGNSQMHGPSRMMDTGEVVLVTMNYRLGVLGNNMNKTRGFGLKNSTVRSESRCALRLRHVDLVVSIEVAVEVCCCFTVFSC
jgi:hypothetical protein